MEAQANPITKAVLDHLPVLEFLRSNGEATPADIASATGRVPSNVRRDLPKLVEANLLSRGSFLDGPETFGLEHDGQLALEAIDRARNPDLAVAVATTGLHAEFAPNPDQPRKKFDQQKLEELADTVEEVGIIEPIVVLAPRDDGLKLIHAGERRWRAAGLVNARHDDPNRVRIPFVIRDVAAEDAALEAQVVALVENGQRENLTTYEEAVALRALIPAKYRSARAAAKPTGFDEKTVQDRLKALEVLKGDDLEAWKADTMTWRQVRDIFRPPVQAESDPAQMDIEEVTGRGGDEDPGPWKQDDDHAAWVRKKLRHALGSIKPRDLLAVVELADACHFRPYGDSRPGYTRTWSYETPGGKPQALISDYGCGGSVGGGQPELSQVHPATLEWLTDNGLFQPAGGGSRSAMLYRVRQAVSQGGADQCEVTGRYHTAWLNPPKVTPTSETAQGVPASLLSDKSRDDLIAGNAKADEAQDANDPTPPSARNELATLSRSERIALIETTHKALTQNAATTGRAAQIGAYWLDAGCSRLKDLGLLTFLNAGGELGWCAMWGEKAYAWFKANLPEVFAADGELAISEVQLALAQAEAATMEWSGPTWSGPGYVTPWLNGFTGAAQVTAEGVTRYFSDENPAEASSATEDDGEVQELLDDEFDETEVVRAQEILGRVADHVTDPASLGELLHATGLLLPLRVSLTDAGVVLDGNGMAIFTVDQGSALPRALAAARALLIVAAVNAHDIGREITGQAPASVVQPDKMTGALMRKSIYPDHLVCLEDGRRFTDLAHHLRAEHDMDPGEYLARWKLPRDYPFVAPATAVERERAATDNATALLRSLRR